MTKKPILYSFRRCPYAMRARLAVHASGQAVELREVILRDKPEAMLEASPKGTVPVMLLPDGNVLEESLDIIKWSLANAKPDTEAAHWNEHAQKISKSLDSLIDENDGSFKAALDAYKYPDKFPEKERSASRSEGAEFVRKLDAMLDGQACLYGNAFSVADAAILPFIRQFAHVDQEWFYAQEWKNVIGWLDSFKASERFEAIMPKFDQWHPGDEVLVFGG